MKWYIFNATINNEDVHERIPADSADEALVELSRMGYKNVVLENSTYSMDNGENVVTDFLSGETYCYNNNILDPV